MLLSSTRLEPVLERKPGNLSHVSVAAHQSAASKAASRNKLYILCGRMT